MMSELELWAQAERRFLRDELDWFRGGAKLMSPSGDDISSLKEHQLAARLEHADRALKWPGA
jgi:hypothetical protein